MLNELVMEYRNARAPRFSPYGQRAMYSTAARQALQQARYAIAATAQQARWDALDGFTIEQYDRHIDSEPGASIDCPGVVRLRIVPDDCCSFDDLAGDTYNAEANPDIPSSVMDRERQAFVDRVNQDGVCGVIGEYWHRGAWHDVDSCFGFVGSDWQGSGYDHDIMGAALSAYSEALECDARELEATRPDMYQGAEAPS